MPGTAIAVGFRIGGCRQRAMSGTTLVGRRREVDR
jgi:hypothetical protein